MPQFSRLLREVGPMHIALPSSGEFGQKIKIPTSRAQNAREMGHPDLTADKLLLERNDLPDPLLFLLLASGKILIAGRF